MVRIADSGPKTDRQGKAFIKSAANNWCKLGIKK